MRWGGEAEMIVKSLFREVQANDDRLGRYSDHEGDNDGPTYQIWQAGYKTFKAHCQRAIHDHETAIVTMKNF
jgi:hypothetical protein